ncbi:hypothetical protein PGT21_033123 [Puccinia graminis f. sp. tritici]|uniref:Uncharacterized protein n=1 Tax=Puccinia graminis f. sp. tritici TaxID=56615 RepID=A0A5B0PAG3_PUCGR|nr:hypothetical protein PGT21_033123 [Puccinia graminis f. sp. tritici]KAA1132250.1 hypothetical protein PGTUg99_000243 [Puccinia graminis f. sp. tritici]
MVHITLSNLITLAMVSVGVVLGAPSKYPTSRHVPMEAAHQYSSPMSYSAAKRSAMNKQVNRLSRKSLSNPRIIFMPVKSANSDLAESLSNAASVLRSDTAAVYSSITSLKQNGQLGTPEQLGDDTVFQLTEWQKHADMLRFLGDVKERTDIVDQMDDFSNEIGLALKSAAQDLKQTLLGVNSIITEMPSIRYLLGPMVYNIRMIITDIHHRSEAYLSHGDDKISLSSKFEEDFSKCYTLESIKQFC